LEGTDFQKESGPRCKNSYGETISYKKLAETVGGPKAVRAVGQQTANQSQLLFRAIELSDMMAV
jgi:O6-methylguanine-DNA--protein-cysteine methyltransferase